MQVVGVTLAALTLAATPATSLTIVVHPGEGAAARTWTLRCGPAGGTLPRAAAACTKLAALRAPFAPTPRGIACTQVYGGPQTARVRGVFRGAKVDATFGLGDGCEIRRFMRVGFLFPDFGGSPPPGR